MHSAGCFSSLEGVGSGSGSCSTMNAGLELLDFVQNLGTGARGGTLGTGGLAEETAPGLWKKVPELEPNLTR